MVELWVLEVNAILELARSFKMTDDEIARCDNLDDPVDLQGYYERANLILTWRSANYDVSKNADLLVELAKADGITIEAAQLETPVVNVPFFGGGL